MDKIIKEIKTAIDVALFKHPVMHHVAGDKNKMQYAYGIIVAAALLSLIGGQIFTGVFAFPLGTAIGMAVSQIIFTIIGIYILSVIAKSIFKGHAAHDAFFRVMAYALIVTWVSIVPPLAIIGAIWGLILTFVILKVIHKLTTGGAIGAILVAIIAMALVSLILSPILGVFGISSMPSEFKFKGSDSFLEMNKDKDDFEINVGGEGSIKMEDGKMTIKGADGKVIEINVPE